MSELNFIEYTVNRNEYNPSDIVIALRGLGFQQISNSKNDKATMWSCNGCVLLLTIDDNVSTGFSGIGVNTPNAPDGSKHCETTGLNIFKDINGLNVYSYPIEGFKTVFDEHFDMRGEAGTEDNLQFFGGVVYRSNSIQARNTLVDQLKLRVVNTTENYVTTVCSRNRFNILWDLHSDDNIVDTIVIVTNDIADVVSKYIGRGFDSSPLNDVRKLEIKNKYEMQEINGFPPTHFIGGWDLNLGGKEKSFVIEKMFENALPNVNIIVQERHNHNGLNEETLLYYSQMQEFEGQLVE